MLIDKNDQIFEKYHTGFSELMSKEKAESLEKCFKKIGDLRCYHQALNLKFPTRSTVQNKHIEL